MSKIRSVYQLQERLDTDFSWRVVEVSFLNSLLRSAPERKKNSVIRANIPVLYAHWEGFVKIAAKCYLEFVSCQNLKYEELHDSFVAIGLYKELSQYGVKVGKLGNIMSVDFMRNKMSQTAVFPKEGVINTKSNLNSEVLKEILSLIGISETPYLTKSNFIDESLLARRNSIAHGEYIDVTQDSYKEISDEVIGLMRSFKNDIENHASLELFKRTVGRISGAPSAKLA
ncbi:MAE_28990/MAE_18760 family HEPN-like nuclease [Methylomarinum vadi]|uniref:MAE_28990/MAE_18760 family HEPN-like nuclease n=1 Tax=Methylomarinum vadi TaxID=438855 RepID=UPI000565ADB9|nr:MAE_28990/MAE_18760 family HEPN-like nuclease [Methylomarinum vadi]